MGLACSGMPRRSVPAGKRATGPLDVDRYLARLPPAERAALERIRRLIRDLVPDSTEGIGYGIPTVRFHGNLVHFAAFRSHLSFFAGSGRLRVQFAREVRGWAGTKSALHFTPDRPLPLAGLRNRVATGWDSR